MSEFSNMLNDYFEGFKEIKSGMIIKPQIMNITHKNIIVDLNYKSEGIVPIKEIIETDFENHYSVGDEINLLVESTDDGDGNAILSYNKASKIINMEEVEKSTSENHFIEVYVEKETNRGLVANFKGIECFIPFILCDNKKRKDYSEFVGKKLFVKIMKIKSRSNIIASHKYYLEYKSGINKKEIIDAINIGDEIMVTVKNVTAYGAFVTYNNIDSLLYIKDFSWFNTVDSKEVYTSGDEFKVKVINIDSDEEKIFISKKDIDTSPWDNVIEKHAQDDEIKVKVSDFNRHGVYVRYNENIDFFLHRKNIIDLDVSPDERFSIGDELVVRIKEIDHDKRTLKLTMK